MAKKYHHHLTEAVLLVLEKIFVQGVALDMALEESVKAHKKWGGRDRRNVSELVFETTRWLRLHLSKAGHQWKDEQKLDSALVKKALILQLKKDWGELPPALIEAWGPLESNAGESSAADKASMTDFLFERALKSFGEQTDKVLVVANKVAPVFIRPNLMRTNLERLQAMLEKEGINSRVVADSLALDERRGLKEFALKYYGLFEIQDINSQKIAKVVDPQRGDNILDACAGRGGKSLLMADILRGKGSILALDIDQQKLQQCNDRARKAGHSIIRTQVSPEASTMTQWTGQFEKVLLDVPCSGVGIIRRHPERKWLLPSPAMTELLATQKKLLEDYAFTVKKDGHLIYSTCSFLPEENDLQIEEFLKCHPEFSLVKKYLWSPLDDEGDILFAADMVRA
ncbi:MAG: hypothetical protein COW00_02245 [Bdellovibrio sp. CG12_big_fil_rev_8_21_14_0_65_39_13]|nr:MAG: hypothetical protein COW78_14500 [Bdellovibrio sp. CG22_combo_CG10-13_8_21_14_all_39_27]PIQ62202.1 MAG: hypothetical protein COW00_02245 [Bdellovibrio sp. CG12_big_fil_rev_8_21_14_0_65_39_13]PIR34213.1 MAG: hypothetical protein COV37_13990 [Bdellovibrio sp. CG11_big_fil_rev_8_21_14_0_20_39_38]